MRVLCAKFLPAALLFLVGCGGSQRMHQRPAQSASQTSPSQPSDGTRAPSRTEQVPAVIPPIVMTDTQPTTPKSYAAQAPQKPKLPSISEEELKQCEDTLPPLESCKPEKASEAGQVKAVNEVRLCVAKYVAAVDACLCKAGSKKHCQFADDQKREIGKM